MIGFELGWQVAEPAWGWLLLPVLLVMAWRWRRLPRAPFAAAGLLTTVTAANELPLPRTLRTRLWALPACLSMLAMLAVVVAMMRPTAHRPAPALPPGRDLLLCLDTSSSMAALDLEPDRSRLDVGRAVAADFVRARPFDRIGFVAFARYNDLRCPLTSDHEALVVLLDKLTMVQKEGPEDATAIGAAVATAAAALRRSTAKSKVVVVVTDGEENVASALAPDEIAPLHAAQLCAEFGIRVHTIAVGRGNQKPDGRFVALDTTALQQLAAGTGGRFFVATDRRALAQVYAAIDALEANALQPPGVVVQEWFPLALALALLLWLGARSLSASCLSRLP